MSSLEDVKLPEFNPDDILCNPDSHEIGGGDLTPVYIGYNKVLKQTVAIKIFRLAGPKERILQIVEHAKEEGKLMQLARHDNVVQVYGFVKWPSAFGIVMEYCECGNLSYLIDSNNIHQRIPLCVHILAQVARGIAFLHNLPGQYVVHGNPNPFHILLTQKMDVKLPRFGFAELVSSSDVFRMTKVRKQFVKLRYKAPEQLVNRAMKPTQALDVYAFAISTYEVLAGKMNYFDAKRHIEKIYEQMQILNAQDKQTVEVIMDLMKKCLNDDSLKRPSMKEVADVLLKLLDEQDKDVLLQQAETVAGTVLKRYNFSSLEKLVPIRHLAPLHSFLHKLLARKYRFLHFQSTNVADSSLAPDAKHHRASRHLTPTRSFSKSKEEIPEDNIATAQPYSDSDATKLRGHFLEAKHYSGSNLNVPDVHTPANRLANVEIRGSFSTAQSYSGYDIQKLRDEPLTVPVKKSVKYSGTLHESQATRLKEGSFSWDQSYSESDVKKPRGSIGEAEHYSRSESNIFDPYPGFPNPTYKDLFSEFVQKCPKGSFSTAPSYSGSDVTKLREPWNLKTTETSSGFDEEISEGSFPEAEYYSRSDFKAANVNIPDAKKSEGSDVNILDQKIPDVKISEVASSSGVTSMFNLKQVRGFPFVEANVDETGAIFNVGDCKVIFPAMAVLRKVRIKIGICFEEVDDAFRLTPLLKCKPHGLKFHKKIKIILSTFYRAEKDKIPVVIRRAEDEFSDFKFLQVDSLRQETQSFKFSTYQFSWFDGILLETKKKLKIVREKALLFGVSPDSTDVLLEMACTVVICHNMESAKVLDKMNKAFETNFFLKCDNQELNLEITGSNIHDYQSIIQNAQCERDASSFNLRKKNTEGWLGDKVHIHLSSKSGKTLVDKDVVITKPCLEPITTVVQRPSQQSDVTMDMKNCNIQGSTFHTSRTHHDGQNT
uniref:Receptor-interacting serine/threonine-protein kinase 1-like n=1 Tax=Phallusia mammillata TaxID=59560 RepID=A0A6F9DQZ3_9ASCI|nr:receptor-interacting serine/threonine-protein kinase 1-like [Phallusia mammillata]